ncbi:hypothetical protein A0H81_00911 [Grifola frondosa]|uniref:F-box domain-containing protein n=1 Tax=Grifola frondosa TaxID=5627 RepID=A0A1C7MXV6_GRIFR|nr:hypothetical protein A0H81_00911 [Grifola frondosa]
MAEATWFKMLVGDWALRTSQETLNVIQRRSYTTKKAIMSTCRTWSRLGIEFLYRCLFFSDPSRILRLKPIMDHNLGRRAKRLHIMRYYSGGVSNLDSLQNALVSIIRHCPKLEIFIVNWSIADTVPVVIDALCTYCSRSLRTIHLRVPTDSLAKIIMMLEAMPKLTAAHIEFEGPLPESFHLGVASHLSLTLTTLQQLSLRGTFQEFAEQAMEWNMPALRSLSLDFVNHRDNFPDIIEFLERHGSQLTFLDINCIPSLEVATILDLCPLLTTFAFNPDWHIWGSELLGIHESSKLVNRPHENITTIGCHQLLYAFGVGYAKIYETTDPLVTQSVRFRNDRNFAALNKTNFPRLECIRLLNRGLLRDLEAANGPSQGCFRRWERWWNQCCNEGIRLEDCTGNFLGTLPVDPEDEEDTDTPRDSIAMELRELLEECRRMTATR